MGNGEAEFGEQLFFTEQGVATISQYIAKAKEGDSRAADIIKNWIRNRSTLEFLGAPSITPDGKKTLGIFR